MLKYGEYSTLDSGKLGKFKNIFKTDRLQLTDTNGITSSKTTRIWIKCGLSIAVLEKMNKSHLKTQIK